jgi:hypothetical protein
MDDEREPLEIETQLRATLTPPSEVVDRVIRRALAGGHQRPRSTYLKLFAVAAALALLAGGATVWRQGMVRRQPLASSMTIVGDGSMLVVEREDGRRWFVGPRLDRRAQGHYVIVLPE